VRSDPRIGLLLLLPILGALVAPGLLRRRTTNTQPAPAPTSLGIVPIAIESGPALGSTIVQPPSVVVIPSDVARCTTCDAPLLRAGARFCADCGAAQPAPQAAPTRRIFCDQCGRPMRDGAQFCADCGATTPAQGLRVRG
jgi:hypothetical protein